jgi:hypothetical protein
MATKKRYTARYVGQAISHAINMGKPSDYSGKICKFTRGKCRKKLLTSVDSIKRYPSAASHVESSAL